MKKIVWCPQVSLCRSGNCDNPIMGFTFILLGATLLFGPLIPPLWRRIASDAQTPLWKALCMAMGALSLYGGAIVI